MRRFLPRQSAIQAPLYQTEVGDGKKRPAQVNSVERFEAHDLPVTPENIITRINADTPNKGSIAIPDNAEAVSILLEQANGISDLEALDFLQSAFPRSTRESTNRVILAIAIAVTKNFGMDDHLPMTSVCAWSMLDRDLFSDEFARQLSTICTFILGWQTDKRDFLILEPSEIALIELMFESMHPQKQGVLAAKVMDFKVLSNRRLGLIRRIPNRIEHMINVQTDLSRNETIIQYAKDCLVLLDHIARPGGFAPIIEEAKSSALRIVKIIHRLTAPPVSEPVALPAPHDTPAPPAAAPPPSPPPKRLTKRHRTEAVLRLLRGENVDQIAQSLGVKAPAVEGWTEAFLMGGASALSLRESRREPADLSNRIHELQSRIDQLTQLIKNHTDIVLSNDQETLH